MRSETVSDAKPLMMTNSEAAAELRVSESKLYELKRDGEIRSVQLGPKTIRIPYSEIEAYLDRMKAEQWTGAA
jgi:excisionase family DNA binding protein